MFLFRALGFSGPRLQDPHTSEAHKVPTETVTSLSRLSCARALNAALPETPRETSQQHP